MYSPNVYSSRKDIRLEHVALLMDGLELATTKVRAATTPDVNLQQWLQKIIEALEVLPVCDQWRSLPLLVGILSSIKQQSPHKMIQAEWTHKKVQQMFTDFVSNLLEYCSIHLYPEMETSVVVHTLLIGFSGLSEHSQKLISTPLFLQLSMEHVYSTPCGHLDVYSVPHTLCATSLTRQSTTLNCFALPNLNVASIAVRHLIQGCSPGEFVATLESLQVIVKFCSTLSSEYENFSRNNGHLAAERNARLWNYLKLSLFSAVIALQGFATRISQPKPQRFDNSILHREHTAVSIYAALSDLHFIIVQMNLTGFPALDFVNFACLTFFFESRSRSSGASCSLFHKLICPFLASSFNTDLIGSNLVKRGKLIFLLNFAEVMVHSTIMAEQELSLLMPLVKQLLRPPIESSVPLPAFVPVMEAAHSVMLAAITSSISRPEPAHNRFTILGFDVWKQVLTPTSCHSSFISEREISDYFNVVLSLFPSVLSLHQFSLAVNTILQAFSVVFPPSHPERAEWILDQICIKALECSPECPDFCGNTAAYSDIHLADRPHLQPLHSPRSIVFRALVHTLPHIHMPLFQPWLVKCDNLIKDPKLTERDREALYSDLFQMITCELIPPYIDIAISWWFSNQHRQV